MPKPTAFHERSNGGSSPAFSTHTGSTEHLYDTSGNAPQATDPAPHVRGVEGDPTRLSGSRPGGSLWRRHRGRLPVHLDAHRCSDWLDGMSPPLVLEPGGGPGCP